MPEHVFKRPELLVPDSIAAGLYDEMRQDAENFLTFLFNQKDAQGNQLLTGVYTNDIPTIMEGYDARYKGGKNIVYRWTDIPDSRDDDLYVQAQYKGVNPKKRFQEGDTTQSVEQDTIDFQIKTMYGEDMLNLGPGPRSPEVPEQVIEYYNIIELYKYEYGDDVDKMPPSVREAYEQVLAEFDVIKSQTINPVRMSREEWDDKYRDDKGQKLPEAEWEDYLEHGNSVGTYQNYLYNIHYKRAMNMGFEDGKETWMSRGLRRQQEKDMFGTYVHEIVHGQSALPEHYYPVKNEKTGELEYPRAEFGAGPNNLYGESDYNLGDIIHTSEPIPIYNEQGHTVSYEYPVRPGASQEDFRNAQDYVYLKAFDKDGDGKVSPEEHEEGFSNRKAYNQMRDWLNIANPLEKNRSKTDVEGNFVQGKNFIDRIVDPTLNIGKELIDEVTGENMTHVMASGSYTDNYGGVLLAKTRTDPSEGDVYVEGRIRHIAYPEVVDIGGEKFHRFKQDKEKDTELLGIENFFHLSDREQAYEYAISTGEFIEFNSKVEAEWFAKNYKTYWDLEGINPYQ